MSQQINLFNTVFLNQGKYLSMRTMLQALGLIVLGSVLFYGYAMYHVRQMHKESDETNKRYADEVARLASYTAGFSPQEASKLLEGELKSAEANLAAQRETIGILKGGVGGNITGYSRYMLAFARQSVNGLWLTGFNITGDAAQMSINGAVLSPELLPAYIGRLSEEQAMRGKSFASLQMQRGGKDGRYVEFTLQSAEINGAVK